MARCVNVASVLFTGREEPTRSATKEATYAYAREALASLADDDLDLVVLCESIEASGQDLDDAEEVKRPGRFLSLYLDHAARTGCHIAGSVKLREGDRVYNSVAFVAPEGVLGAYHKTNLTIGEIDEGLSSGRGAVVVDSSIGRLGGLICFDLNFDPLLREYAALKPDILCFSSNYHGGLMQAQWAYQCRSFFVSSLYFLGGGILDPFGRELALTDCYTTTARATLNLDRAMVHLDYNRERFPEILRKYRGEVSIDVPANIGSALIYSLADARSALDIVAEFGLELVDDYFARATERNAANRAPGTPQSLGKSRE